MENNLFNEEPFQSTFIDFQNYLYNCKNNQTQYRWASNKITFKFEGISPYTNLTSDFVDDLLQKNKFAWVNERPPLDWYAAALSALHLKMNFSPKTACLLAKASNYYGNFDLAKNMSISAKKNSSSDIAFQATKQLSKAYKNDGDFENSKIILQQAFFEFLDGNCSGRTAYLYLLFAKLCNDYQQKQGWHQEFHKIAYERMEKCADAPAKWKELSLESYAKSISTSNPEKAIKLYRNIFKNSSMNSDIHVRNASHFCEIKILHSLKNYKTKDPKKLFFFFEKHLEECWMMINQSEELGNYKAEIVRKGHLLRLVRKIELWRRSIPDFKKKQIDIINDFVSGEAISIADRASKVAYIMNDWRTLATLEYEKGMWIKYILHDTLNINQDYRRSNSIYHFDKALTILKKPKQTLTFLYHLVLNVIKLTTRFPIHIEFSLVNLVIAFKTSAWADRLYCGHEKRVQVINHLQKVLA